MKRVKIYNTPDDLSGNKLFVKSLKHFYNTPAWRLRVKATRKSSDF
jgi:hypothetical protein